MRTPLSFTHHNQTIMQSDALNGLFADAKARKVTARFAIRNFEMEGVQLNSFATELIHHWVNGEVEIKEAPQRYLDSVAPRAKERNDPQEVEAYFLNAAIIRNIALLVNPIAGNFDIGHLRRVHAYLFQDESKFQDPTFRPGEIRDRTPKDWYKRRKLTAIKLNKKSSHFLDAMQPTSMAVYSRMDLAAEQQLFNILNNADPADMRELDVDSAAKYIANLFEGLDYIHPFNDGNSRTLRTFTTLFARQAGYDLDWTKISEIPEDRERFNVARDLATLERGMDGLSEYYREMAESRFAVFAEVPGFRELVLGGLVKRPVKRSAEPNQQS